MYIIIYIVLYINNLYMHISISSDACLFAFLVSLLNGSLKSMQGPGVVPHTWLVLLRWNLPNPPPPPHPLADLEPDAPNLSLTSS
jgi:hypothetical protein